MYKVRSQTQVISKHKGNYSKHRYRCRVFVYKYVCMRQKFVINWQCLIFLLEQIKHWVLSACCDPPQRKHIIEKAVRWKMKPEQNKRLYCKWLKGNWKAIRRELPDAGTTQPSPDEATKTLGSREVPWGKDKNGGGDGLWRYGTTAASLFK